MLPQLDLTQYILLLTVIAGVTELIARLRAKDLWAALTITSAAVVGLLFGIFGVESLTPITGLAVGFAAPGAISVLGSFGKKSTPAPSDAIAK